MGKLQPNPESGCLQMDLRSRFTRVDFERFKAFERFSLNLRHFNVLVGPNNAGKSTVLAAFRALAAGLRRANSRKPHHIQGPAGRALGYPVDLTSLSVGEENIFFNYDESHPASVRFKLDNGNTLLLFFPEAGYCYLVPDAGGIPITSPTSFRKHFDVTIGFVPILGPVEHSETLFERDAARLALYNYGAARNFRNIWLHFPEGFDDFRQLLQKTWPEMDMEPPRAEFIEGKYRLSMFCRENRISREISWAGFGFQVWCQMLTHIIQHKSDSVFLIDEPDIYLHSNLQRQLVGILRNLGCDVIVATHSTEIITEVEAEDIVVIDKNRKSASRIRSAHDLGELFRELGSGLNPTLTQLAKTRRVLFVEGQDFKILSRFARRLGFETVASEAEFAVIPIEGFNPEKAKNLAAGMAATLGTRISTAIALDRDYRCKDECSGIIRDCQSFASVARIHSRKEVENFLLVPDAIDRASERRIADRAKREGCCADFVPFASQFLNEFASKRRPYVSAQLIDATKRYASRKASRPHDATINQQVLEEIEQLWDSPDYALSVIPGKEALSALNQFLQQKYSISITPPAVIESMKTAEIPSELVQLLTELSNFATDLLHAVSELVS